MLSVAWAFDPPIGHESPPPLSFRAKRGICFFVLTAKADSSSLRSSEWQGGKRLSRERSEASAICY